MSTVQASSASMDEYGTESFIPTGALAVDDRYQRPPNPLRIRQMTPFNPSLVGRLTVSQRADGTLWVVDGQHRLAAAKNNGVQSVPCTVYKGWALKDEAWIFEFKNRTQVKPSQFELHKAAVLFGDPIALDLEAIAAEFGGALGPRNSPKVGTRKHIACVDSLRQIYGLKNEHGRYPVGRYPKTNGREHLRRTLLIIDGMRAAGGTTWGNLSEERDDVKPFQGVIVKGMATFLWYASDDPNFEESTLLGSFEKMLPAKLALIASNAEYTGLRPYRAIARVVKTEYNKHTRTKKLGDWDLGSLLK